MNDNVKALESKFDGGVLELIGINIVQWLLIIITLGIALPWAVSMKYKWVTNHTTINGKRLKFIGSGGSLFVNYIKWWLLTLITFGIYGFWLEIKLHQWKVKNTIFDN